MRSRKRSKKRTFPWRQLGVLVLVGALAIICGWMINTLLLQGYLWAPGEPGDGALIGNQPDPTPNESEPNNEQEPSAPVTTQVELRSVRFYLTQVGAVGTEAGANSLISTLQEQGTAGAYHYDGELYRVFAGIFAERAAADGLSILLKSMQIDAFVKEMAWPTCKGELTGEAGAYFEVVKPAIAEMEETFSLLLSAQGLDRNQIITLQSSIQEAQTTLAQARPAADFNQLHSKLVAASDKLKAALDGARQFVETANDHSRLLSESRLIEFAELYQQFASAIRNLLS